MKDKKALLNSAMQQKRMEIFYEHYFGDSSPWNKNYVKSILK